MLRIEFKTPVKGFTAVICSAIGADLLFPVNVLITFNKGHVWQVNKDNVLAIKIYRP